MTGGVNPTSPYNKLNNAVDLFSTYKTNIDGNSVAAMRISSNFNPHAQASPDMTIAVDAGHIFNGVTLTEVAAQNTSAITAPVSNSRIDRVVVDQNTGAVSVITGVSAVSPSPPAITAGNVPIAQVLVDHTATTLGNSVITDERDLNQLGGSANSRTVGYAADTGSANAYAVAPTPAILSYAAGQIVTLKPVNAQTGAATLAVSGLAAKNIKTTSGADPVYGMMLTTGEYDLVYDGTNFVLLNPSIGTGGYAGFGYAANNYYYGLGNAKSVGTRAAEANKLYMVPFAVGAAATFTRIGIDITTGAGSTHARLGIYNAKAGIPSTLILDAGAVATATTGDKEITISVSLTPGPYFLVAVFDGTPVYETSGLIQGMSDILGDQDPSSGYYGYIYDSLTYGALPSPYAGTPTYDTNKYSPALWLRVV